MAKRRLLMLMTREVVTKVSMANNNTTLLLMTHQRDEPALVPRSGHQVCLQSQLTYPTLIRYLTSAEETYSGDTGENLSLQIDTTQSRPSQPREDARSTPGYWDFDATDEPYDRAGDQFLTAQEESSADASCSYTTSSMPDYLNFDGTDEQYHALITSR